MVVRRVSKLASALLAATIVAPLTAPASGPAAAAQCAGACVAIGSVSVLEGDTGTRTVTLPVTLSQPTGIVTVQYRIQGLTATGGPTPLLGVDVRDKGGVLGTVTFAAGATARTVPVTVYADTAVELDETFVVTLSNVTGATIVGGLATGTILNDDAAANIRVGIGDATIAEGDSGVRRVAFPITLSTGASSLVKLGYTLTSGTAIYGATSAAPGADFGGTVSGTITFAVTTTGTTAVLKRLSVPVWPETISESDQTFSVTLAPITLPAGGSITRSVGTGTILNDDSTTAVPVPNSMAAIGDSITAGANSCPPVSCPASSWSTGTDITSHYQRILAINPAISGRAFNNSVSGSVMGSINQQATQAVAQGVDYVTILLGANDVCKRTEAEMTPVATLQAQLQTGMTTLTNGLPNARIFVASIPDIKRLWEVGHGSAAALSIWNAAQICQSMLANPTSTAPADVARRDRVRQRAIDDNIAIAAVCSQYPNCKFDNHATFNYPFALSQLSTMDYFHPSAALQAVLAQVTYAAGYNW